MHAQPSRTATTTTLRVTAAALATAAGIAVVGWNLSPTGARAQTPPPSFPLMGIVRDFAPSHPDFTPGRADSLTYSVGNVSPVLNAKDLPVYTGAGVRCIKPALDAKGRPIAPGQSSAYAVTSFTITGSKVSANEPMAAKIRVIGAAISAGGRYDCAVTTRALVGSASVEPFGPFTGAMSGNVNDAKNPRSFVLPTLIQPGTSITIDGRSWSRKNASDPSLDDSDWSEIMTINSTDAGKQLVALRNGDAAPDVAGFLGQVSAKNMLVDYIDAKTGRITLAPNQVIYLFELGVTDPRSDAFDMQDLVVLVDLASDPSYFDTPTGPSVPPCVTIHDTPAELGSANAGGVASPDSFAQWFDWSPNQSLAATHTITMTRDSSGVYAYSAPDFHPVDDDLYGNAGNTHNRGFTFMIDAEGTYSQCAGQFVEFQGDGDTWLFVNGRLVVDLGGLHTGGASQFVEIDRLGFTDGEKLRVQLFHAQRSTSNAAFALKTNMTLTSNINPLTAPPVSGLRD